MELVSHFEVAGEPASVAVTSWVEGEMMDIVAIHGINMHRSLRTRMQQDWHAAIVAGLTNVRSPHAQTLSIECAFYGHEYNDGKAGTESEYAAIDIEPGFETELVLGISSALGDVGDDKTKFYLPGILQSALAGIQRSELFDGRDTRLISFVKQVDRYLSDAGFRGLVHAEMATAMAQSPRLVIGHSLGSVIAYNWLRENDPGHPVALITLGSPLGFEAIRRQVGCHKDRSCWPGRVSSWTNIAAGHDAVAMVKELAPLYSPGIRDEPCDNPRKSAHAALSYLVNVRTARAIDRALA
jgi:hypothetical protein